MGQLGGKCPMVAAPNDIERRLVVASQPAAQLAKPALRGRVVVCIDQASELRLRKAFGQPFQGWL
ncbi:MAG TPA: hypothetical protein VIK00_04465, partial [Candidatus Limnocylindrales bacterium]